MPLLGEFGENVVLHDLGFGLTENYGAGAKSVTGIEAGFQFFLLPNVQYPPVEYL